MAHDFRKRFDLEKRRKESFSVLSKFPDKIPIICEKNSRSSPSLPNLDKIKYLVPKDITMSQFYYTIRRRIKIPKENALFFRVGYDVIPSGSQLVGDVYDLYRDEDGFLYVSYIGENTFG